MKLNLQKFYQACNPSRTLALENREERQYYIDLASVQGGKIIQELARTIARLSPDDPTCQLFTGHIGCGKSTELLRLKMQLEQEGFHVVYFESSQDLEMADVDVTDVLLAIARQVSKNLEETEIKLRSPYFERLLQEVSELLQAPLHSSAEELLSSSIAKITVQTKESPKLRSRLRQYLEPRTSGILAAINSEVILPATEQLKQRGKRGLVTIVDNLDRVDNRILPSGRSQPEYLFVDRGEQLRQLKCHLVYTIPLSLIFSHELEGLKSRLGGGLGPKVLPMVPVQNRDGGDFEQGMNLLRNLVLARAFPEEEPEGRLGLTTKVFDSSETLDRLCRASGGHVRNLLGLIYRCLQKEDPPLSRQSIEAVIQERAQELVLAITQKNWQLLRQVHRTKNIQGDARHQNLLRNMFIFEYRGGGAMRWFDINPLLAETKEFVAGSIVDREDQLLCAEGHIASAEENGSFIKSWQSSIHN